MRRRKHEMFAAVDEALARLYPTRRWDERDEEAALAAGLDAGEGEALAEALATGCGRRRCFFPAPRRRPVTTSTFSASGARRADRAPGGGLDPVGGGRPAGRDRRGRRQELYLRVALSTLRRFAAVQEVTLSARAHPDDGGRAIVLTETPRAGVFDAVLLRGCRPWWRSWPSDDIRHLDFGEIVEPPAGFDPGDYAARWSGAPSIANYLFYPQAPAAVTTVTLT